MKQAASVLLAAAAAAMVLAASAAEPRPGTAELELDHGRMIVDLELRRPDGSWRAARAWIDTGGTDMTVSEPLARDLGVDLAAMPAAANGAWKADVPLPALRLAGVLLDVEGMTLSVRPGRFAMPGIPADCVLVPRCLRKLHVVFDGPERTLTVGRPGASTPRGAAVPCRVHPETGLFMVEATIAGERVALGVDTGSAGTWVSDLLVSAWDSRFPDRPRATGAAGSANFFGFPFESEGVLALMPSLALGALAVSGEIAVLGLDQGLFDWYARKSAAPVAGFLGAGLICRCRLEVDFSAQMTWWTVGPAPACRDLDIVPLTLRPEADGSYAIAGVVRRDGRPLLAGVMAGDRLLAVDGVEVSGATMGRVVGALRGKPGEPRLLLLERDGRRLSERVSVVRLP
jgi:hypothetical protein